MKPEWIAPHRTALILIDCQVDFGAQGGAMARAGADMSSVPPALAKAGALADVARGAKVEIVFVRLVTRSGEDNKFLREARQRQEDTLPDLCVEGSRGAEFIGPLPRPGETVISKTRFSAFAGTGLADHLRARGIDTLVLAGLTTECCVQSSAWDALERDFHVFVAGDACAAYEPELHRHTLRALALNGVFVEGADIFATFWNTE
jgi:ureidoacrylate peracid hydrolase